MPWKLTDKGGGWSTRAVPGSTLKGATGLGKCYTGHVVIYKDGEPVDRAVNRKVANERIKGYKSGRIPLP